MIRSSASASRSSGCACAFADPDVQSTGLKSAIASATSRSDSGSRMAHLACETGQRAADRHARGPGAGLLQRCRDFVVVVLQLDAEDDRLSIVVAQARQRALVPI